MIDRNPERPRLPFRAVPAVILCHRCGSSLNGRIHRDTPAGPECAVPCGSRTFQLFLPEPGPAAIPACDLRQPHG